MVISTISILDKHLPWQNWLDIIWINAYLHDFKIWINVYHKKLAAFLDKCPPSRFRNLDKRLPHYLDERPLPVFSNLATLECPVNRSAIAPGGSRGYTESRNILSKAAAFGGL